MRFTTLLSAATLPATILAAQINITILSTPLLTNPSSLPPSTIASLSGSGHDYEAHINTKNTFTFSDVPKGSYLMDITAPGPDGYVFPPLRIDVLGKPSEVIEGGAMPASGSKMDVGDKEMEEREIVMAWGTWRGNEWENRGEVYEALEWAGVGSGKSFGVKAVGKREFLIERQGCKYLFSFLLTIPLPQTVVL